MSRLRAYNYAEASRVVTLPASVDGYIIVNDRCCLPAQMTNIDDPGNQSVGLRPTIPPTAILNSSPTFRALPPVRVCAGTPISIDLSATDTDSDSVRYSLLHALEGVSTATDPKPFPTSPLLNTILFSGPYTPSAFAGPGNTVSLDGVSGMLTGTIYTQGAYLFSVLAEEYRGGSILGGARRTYILQVLPCKKETAASIARDEGAVAIGAGGISIVRCGGQRTVQFENTSTGTSRYFWNFGDTGTVADTSTLPQPSYTYPAPAATT